MKRNPVYLSIAFILVLAACAYPETTATEEPPAVTPIPPTATEEPPAATQEPPTAIQEPSPEPTNSEGEIPTNEVTVNVVDSSYRLRVIEVPVGTTVTWIYDAGLPHTVTSDTGLFGSGTLAEGDTFSYTFTEEGVFPYFCRFHGSPGGSGMSGVINVTEG